MNRDENISRNEAALQKYIPTKAVKAIAGWIVDLKVHFVIAGPRKSKLGDFTPSYRGKPARISVNGNLNPYNFLITTIHEFAHLGCHLKYGNTVPPHGREWKKIYIELLQPFMGKKLFPDDLEKALSYHVAKPAASSCSCPTLSRALNAYDENPLPSLDEIGCGKVFLFQQTEYTALEKRRTRYLCKRLFDGRKYLISGRASVDTKS